MRILELSCALLVLSSHYLTPAQIVVFSFTGASGNETTFSADAQPANAAMSAMSRGSGVSASSSTNTFSGSSWTTASTIDPTDYFTFSITPNNGLQLSLSSLSLDERRSATGIRNWSVRSSLDNFASSLSTFQVPDDANTRTGETTTFGSSFQNLTSGVEFRIYGYGSESASGTWRIDNVQLSGSLAFTSMPEPHEYATFAGLGLLAFAFYRRRKMGHGPTPV